ncbi:hypothetical protein ABZY09_33495 [Streptomyces sp. NPDC002928]|uniref:hypothetical protein n=1 Tax=Streptomyces sp. NPDC002928 TaxID=3154440 RepID=UPI0033A90CFD
MTRRELSALGQQLLHRRVPLGGAGRQPPWAPEDISGAVRWHERHRFRGGSAVLLRAVADSVTVEVVMNASRMHG